jgi:dihydroorotase
MMKKKIRKPSDMHMHFRHGPLMILILYLISRRYKYGVAMGNLKKPISNATEAIRYANNITYCSTNAGIQPIPTIMFLNSTTRKIIREAGKAGIKVIKLISGGTSTNSSGGVPLIDLEKKQGLFEEMEKWEMISSNHCELVFDPKTGNTIHWQEREERGIQFFEPIVRKFPGVKFVFEHLSTRELVDFVLGTPSNVAGTITPQHLKLIWKNVIASPRAKEVLFPHNYCLPMAKTITDRKAVTRAAISGNRKFFAGSDIALHLPEFKRLIDPRAGVFDPFAIEDYTEVFEENNAPDKLENFLSVYGPEYYGLEAPEETIEIVKENWIVPPVLEGIIVPFGANTRKTWKVLV